MRIIAFGLLAMFPLTGSTSVSTTPPEHVSVGSLNLEWFGHGNNPRTDAEIEAVAGYIKALEIDFLCLQEIHPTGDRSGDGEADWQQLLDHLGSDYGSWYGTSGGSQRLAFIWNETDVTVSDLGELRGITRETPPDGNARSFPRLPLTAYVRSNYGGVDFRVFTVHLYWSDDDARAHEGSQLGDWLEDYLATGDDEDVILIGDCNIKNIGLSGDEEEDQESEFIDNLLENDQWVWISEGHDEPTTPTSQERYDNAFISPGLEAEYVEGSWDVRREAVEAALSTYTESISNHCPVSLLLTDEDNDSSPAGSWGLITL